MREGTMEIGLLLPPVPGRSARTAARVESLGFDCALFPDSQNMAPEVWGQLMLAASATQKIRLGPGVTNSITRDPSVTASAALALQFESGGRALLAIGRGDSSVQRIGKHEDPLASFERHVTALQAYLRGESIDRDGFASRLEWLRALPPELPKVPVEIAATGPRVIALAARRADRIGLAVGADPEHVRERLEAAREAARLAGRDLRAMRFGAFVNCVLHEDRTVARDAIRGSAATFARFSSFRGNDLARLPTPLRVAAGYLREHYDMRHHTRATAAHAQGLPDEFIDWFGIAGPVEHGRERLQRLAALGLDFVHLIVGSTGAPREVTLGSIQLLAEDVLPGLASRGAARGAPDA